MARPRRTKARIPNRHTLGIDEAGRGPAVGPMVMAAVALDSKAAAALSRRGLTDSKTYGAGEDAHAIRCDLAAEVRKRALFVETVVVSSAEIDNRVSRNELNVLERELAVMLIDKAPTVDKIIADGKRMFQPLCLRYDHFESRDHAEEHHAAVAAASVIAKVLRDTLFDEIKKQYEDELGPITGGGYANAATRRWLRAYVERYGRLPPETRMTWPHPYVADLIEVVKPSPQLPLI
jgi:ribonuclease HII